MRRFFFVVRSWTVRCSLFVGLRLDSCGSFAGGCEACLEVDNVQVLVFLGVLLDHVAVSLMAPSVQARSWEGDAELRRAPGGPCTLCNSRFPVLEPAEGCPQA